MELSEARAVLNGMKRQFRAIENLERVILAGERLLGEKSALEVAVVKLTHTRDTLSEEVARIQESIAASQASLDNLQDKYAKRVEALSVNFDATLRDFEAEIADKKAEALEKYEAVLEAVSCAEEALNETSAKIAKADKEYADLVTKYTEFKRSL